MSKGTIILVDDDAKHRRLYTDFLSGHGYNVIAAPDWHEALCLLYRVTPKLILLDILMPELNGIGTCKRIRAIGARKMPILFITASPSIEQICNGSDRAMTAYGDKRTFSVRVSQYAFGGKADIPDGLADFCL